MARTKLYKIIIAILILINIGTLAFFLMGRPSHQPPQAGDLARILEIDGPNKQTIFKLEKDHHVKKRALLEKDRKLHEELFSKIGTGYDVNPIHAKIESNFTEIEKMTYAFFHDVSAFCTDEQKMELKNVIDHAFNQMRKGPKK
jgi:hypothetical protein